MTIHFGFSTHLYVKKTNEKQWKQFDIIHLYKNANLYTENVETFDENLFFCFNFRIENICGTERASKMRVKPLNEQTMELLRTKHRQTRMLLVKTLSPPWWLYFYGRTAKIPHTFLWGKAERKKPHPVTDSSVACTRLFIVKKR